MWTAKKNIIIQFIYFEKDVISGTGYLSVYLGPKQGELWCCTFLHTSSLNLDALIPLHLYLSFTFLSAVARWDRRVGGSGGSLKGREAGLCLKDQQFKSPERLMDKSWMGKLMNLPQRLTEEESCWMGKTWGVNVFNYVNVKKYINGDIPQPTPEVMLTKPAHFWQLITITIDETL